MLILAPNDLESRHVGLEMDMGQDPIALRRHMEVLEHLRLSHPSVIDLRPASAPDTILHPLGTPPDVEGAILGLDLRGLVCCGDPAITTNLVIAIEAHDVVIVAPHVVHGGFEAVVAHAEDAHWVRPCVARVLEPLATPYGNLAGNILVVALCPIIADEGEIGCLAPKHARNRVLDLLDLCVDEHRYEQCVRGAIDLQDGLPVLLTLLGQRINMCIALSPDDQDVAVKFVKSHISGLASVLKVLAQCLQHGHCCWVASLRVGPDIAFVVLDQLLWLRLQQLLPGL
mmetsp:Transcript_108287/g.231204  ORF Transcript_108287/g.231204 Transcript_108287/m.231204 type:complete len:285 (-) Transcript_108287:171-1025(-)